MHDPVAVDCDRVYAPVPAMAMFVVMAMPTSVMGSVLVPVMIM